MIQIEKKKIVKVFAKSPSTPSIDLLPSSNVMQTSLISISLLLVTYCFAYEHSGGLILHQTKKRTRLITDNADLTNIFYNTIYYNELLIKVDKSLLIEDIIQDPGTVYVITCPHLWGKSTNLYMLKAFFAIQHENGKPILPVSSTKNYRLFVHGVAYNPEGGDDVRMLRAPFLIAQHKNIVDKHLGQYPVILVRLSWCSENMTHTLMDLKEQIAAAFKDHMYAKDAYKIIMEDTKNDNISREKARARYEKFLRLSKAAAGIEDLIESMQFLSSTLFIYTNKKVIILLDDYLYNWHHVFRSFSVEDTRLYLYFFIQFMKATFQSNIYLQKAVITGQLPMFEELRQHALNNVTECNLFTGKFMEHYGFTESEMKMIYDYWNISEHNRMKVDSWYKGYTFNRRPGLVIYNPVSTGISIETKVCTYNWVEIGKYHIQAFVKNFLKKPSFKAKYRTFRKAWHTAVAIEVRSQYLSWADYLCLIKAMVRGVVVNEDFTDKAFMFLLFNGYLTLVGYPRTYSNKTTYQLRFPNTEIRSSYLNYKENQYQPDRFLS